MKQFIKKYIGIIGFIVALIGTSISAYYKFYSKNEFETVGVISFLLWVSTMTISDELNKKNPKKWYIYIVTIFLIFCSFWLLY